MSCLKPESKECCEELVVGRVFLFCFVFNNMCFLLVNASFV